MPANLTITDNANSTATATVTNAAAGDVTSVFYSAWSGETKAYNATIAGNITGNSTLLMSLGAGNFLFQGLVTNGSNVALGQAFHQVITDGVTPIQRRILDAVKTRHDSIGFTFVDAADVLVRFVPNALDKVDGPFPKVYVAPLSVESYNDQLLNRDDIGYPVMLILVDSVSSASSNQTSGMGDLNNTVDWRTRVMKAFRWQRLPGVEEVYITRVEPISVVDIQAFLNKGRIVTALAFRFFVRQSRGI